jgi:membrane protease YdiL (CAAX protease family)
VLRFGVSAERWRDSGWLALADLAIFVAVIGGDYFGILPLSSTPFLFVFGWVSLWLRGLGWRDVGFARPQDWGRALLVGALAGIAMELFSIFVTVPFFSRWTGELPDLSDFQSMVGNFRLLLVLLSLNWTLIAFGEELVFRGWFMSRVAGACGHSGSGWVAGLLFSSMLFGVGHGGQGMTGIIQEGFAGLLLGILFLACRRNLTVPIVAHGVANTLAFLLIYFDRYPGV